MRTYWLSSIDSTRPRRYRVQVLRVGRWKHPAAPNGELVVDPKLLEAVEQSFRDGVFGVDLPVNLNHESDAHDSKGWVQRVYRDGDRLYAEFEVVDPSVEERIRQGRLKYASAELMLDWHDPETRQKRHALRALALTNRPYIKHMEPIQPLNLSEFIEEETMGNTVTLSHDEYEELMSKVAYLNELSERVDELQQVASGLTALQTENQREALLSEFRDAVPPSVMRLFELAFRHADGQSVSCSELTAHAREDAVRAIQLSELASHAPVMIQDILYVLLSEIASLGAWNRAWQDRRPVAPSFETHGDRTDTLLARAREYAREHQVDLGEAVKQVVRMRL